MCFWKPGPAKKNDSGPTALGGTFNPKSCTKYKLYKKENNPQPFLPKPFSGYPDHTGFCEALHCMKLKKFDFRNHIAIYFHSLLKTTLYEL